MEELRKEFEELLGYKPHHKLWEAKLREAIDAMKIKQPKTKIIDMEAPPIDPIPSGEVLGMIPNANKWFDATGGATIAVDPGRPGWDESVETIIDTRTPEQIEQDIIDEAAKTVPEFMPEPKKIEVTDEEFEKIKNTPSENPLMTAMAMLLESQTKTNELLKDMADSLKNKTEIAWVTTPIEALKNLTQAQQEAPMRQKKIYKVLILKADLQATDGGEDRSEAGQRFNTEEEATAFGKQYAWGLTPDGKQRYRIYHESIILPSATNQDEIK